MYEPGLSQAALSVLSVDSILSADIDALQSRYHAAIESRQRVTDNVFVRDLQRVADIQRHYLNLRRFTTTYLGDFDKSSFAKVTSSHTVEIVAFAVLGRLRGLLTVQSLSLSGTRSTLTLHYSGA